MRRLQSPAEKGGDMIFWTRIMSRNSPKLLMRHVNLPLHRQCLSMLVVEWHAA